MSKDVFFDYSVKNICFLPSKEASCFCINLYAELKISWDKVYLYYQMQTYLVKYSLCFLEKEFDKGHQSSPIQEMKLYDFPNNSNIL